MKKYAVILVAIALLSGCSYSYYGYEYGVFEDITISGVTVTEDYAPGSFDVLKLEGDIDCTLINGTDYNLSITADENVINEALGIFRLDDLLTVKLPASVNLAGTTVEIVITVPDLSKVSAEDSARLQIPNLSIADRFTLELRGDALVTGTVSVPVLTIDTSSSYISTDYVSAAVTGDAGTLNIDAHIAGQIEYTGVPESVTLHSCSSDSIVTITDPSGTDEINWLTLDSTSGAVITLPSINILEGLAGGTSRVFINGTVADYTELTLEDEARMLFN